MLFMIREPLTVTLDEVDLDDHIPSIKFKLHVAVSCLSYSLNYDGNVWITCKALDDFILSIKNNDDTLSLLDIDGNVLLCLSRLKNNHYTLSLNDIKKSGDTYEISVCYSVEISQDVLEVIKSGFLNYPIWW
ncbi:hypothetical protein ACMWJ4_11395 [Enterobacter sp. BB-069-C-ECC]|uniref:hypothetical protein n=1 Tax=unclassified Enterobacter TaxID=2608935 RepID=UPI0038622D54